MSLIEKYQALEPKEQRALKIAAIAIIFFIFYQFIYQPYQESLSSKQKQLEYQSILNNWMTKAVPKLNQSSKQAHKKTLSASQLLGTTSNSLKNSKLQPFEFNLQQSDGSSIQLTFKEVPYTEFIQWMETFWHQFPLEIKELAISSAKTTGMVSVSLQFDLFGSKAK